VSGPATGILLADDHDRPDAYPSGEILHISVVHTYTSSGNPLSDGRGPICAVNAVPSPGEPHPVGAVGRQGTTGTSIGVGHFIDDVINPDRRSR
jgi:hypothetical protein